MFPLSLIGTLFLTVTMIPFPETWAIKQAITNNADLILIPYRLTLVLITVYLVISIGSNLAKSYSLDPASGSIVALVSFMLTQIPIRPASLVPSTFIDSAATAGLDTAQWMQGLEDLDWVLPQVGLSGRAVYVGIFCALFGVEVLRLSTQYFAKRNKRLEESGKYKQLIHMPRSIRTTLQTILPIFIIVSVMFVLVDIIGFNPQEYAVKVFNIILGAADSYFGTVLYSIVVTLFVFFGIIGFKVSNSTARYSWSQVILLNRLAHNAGLALPKITTLPFFQFFVWIGGSGSTLCLVLLTLFSKSRYLKRLGQTSLIPSLFNLNSPVLYGVPVILNPYLLIPYIVTPIVTTSLTYFCMYFNIVARPYKSMASTMPFFIGAYSTTGDWKAIVLAVINLLLGVSIYYPFFKMYEKKLIQDGQDDAKNIKLDRKEDMHVTNVD